MKGLRGEPRGHLSGAHQISVGVLVIARRRGKSQKKVAGAEGGAQTPEGSSTGGEPCSSIMGFKTYRMKALWRRAASIKKRKGAGVVGRARVDIIIEGGTRRIVKHDQPNRSNAGRPRSETQQNYQGGRIDDRWQVAGRERDSNNGAKW